MTSSDIAYDLFTVFNALRVVSYLPQMYKIARDTTGAAAISYSTWILWTGANGSTAIYSLINLGDITMTWINELNTLCCTAVITLTAFKRAGFAEARALSCTTTFPMGYRVTYGQVQSHGPRGKRNIISFDQHGCIQITKQPAAASRAHSWAI
jgi:hypothetical protein